MKRNLKTEKGVKGLMFEDKTYIYNVINNNR